VVPTAVPRRGGDSDGGGGDWGGDGEVPTVVPGHGGEGWVDGAVPECGGEGRADGIVPRCFDVEEE
jgi:hypothetical protein